MDNLALGCLTGQARVIVWTMNAMVPSIFGNLLEGTMIILGNFRKRHRGTYDHFELFCFAKETQHATWPIIEGNKWSNPRGASVIGIVHFHAFLSLN